MLNHRGTETLRTERLILRRFTKDDAAQMYENWAKDERVTRFLTWAPHTSPRFTEKLLKEWIKNYKNDDFYNWVIEFQGEAIGNISAVNIDENSERCELGYCIGVDFWGRGIMTEAARAVIDYLFEEVSFNRIEISHAVKNPASGKVAQKCSLSFEGTKRGYFKALNGEFLDISFYGILKRDWEKLKEERK